MEAACLRLMRFLHMRKIIICILFLLPLWANAQFNLYGLSRKQIYFGIALGANVSNYTIIKKPFLAENDSIKGFSSKVGPGFNLGIVGNWQFHRYFDLRFIPALSFADKIIEYQTVNKKASLVRQTVSSIYLNFPLLVRFKSEPIKDFRLYVIAGMRYDIDMASNANVRDKLLLKVNKHDASAVCGVGVMIYFPYFIMSPEFSFSHGFININSPTQGYVYSRVIDQLYSRTFTFTLHLEG